MYIANHRRSESVPLVIPNRKQFGVELVSIPNRAVPTVTSGWLSRRAGVEQDFSQSPYHCPTLVVHVLRVIMAFLDAALDGWVFRLRHDVGGLTVLSFYVFLILFYS